MNYLVTVIGSSGVGKTTLVCALAKAAPFATAYEDHTTRPFQSLFKQDARFALANQIDYLLLRAEQERILRQLPQIGLIDGGLDLDFHGFTRLFLSRRYLTPAEYELCQRFYTLIRSMLPLPDLIIRMKAPREIVKSRLSGRDRINIASEDDFDLLESFLDEWLLGFNSHQILNIDVSEHDPSFENIIPSLNDEIKKRLANPKSK